MKKSIAALILVMTAMPLCAKSVRIRGAVGGTWEAPLTVRIGSGPYTPAAKRRLNAPDAYGLARPGGGIVPANAIPASPSQWQFAHVVDGSFLSDPVDVATTPVVVAFDAVKRMRVIDVAVAADVEDGAIVDAGMLTLEPTAGLAVELEPPLTDLPMVFFLGVVNAGVDERRRPAILRQLSVLDQVAPRTFDLLAMGDVGVLPASGRTMVAALPPPGAPRAVELCRSGGAATVRPPGYGRRRRAAGQWPHDAGGPAAARLAAHRRELRRRRRPRDPRPGAGLRRGRTHRPGRVDTEETRTPQNRRNGNGRRR